VRAYLAALTPGRRWAVRLAAVAAAAVVLTEILELAMWPLPFGSLYLLALVASLGVPIVGAVLVARGDERGIAVLAAGGLMVIPVLMFAVIRLIWWTDPITPFEFVLAVLAVFQSAALLASGIVAWRHRQASLWVWGGRHSWAYTVVAIITFAVGALWPMRVLVPPNSLADVPFMLQAISFGIVLVAAARLARPLAAAALITAVAPVLATALFDLGRMIAFGVVMQDLVAFADLLGRAVLLGIGIHWLRAEQASSRGVTTAGTT
jgi:hypothetical protein